jgi:hypothetical protein
MGARWRMAEMSVIGIHVFAFEVYIPVMEKRACLAWSCLPAATFVSVMSIAGVVVEAAFCIIDHK